uniref:Uncharacterized protein n=1 Tax=Favella ehrenbergii TaxID=182087 RepID=A0A7S3MKP5_9SPIT|mmetsp:Transcript_22072/g.27130  ORF Transcript_22072/g.27130 Transcript_22072/m.27130 type:complete len:106 (+) Transcript_22072:84-401(+)
MFVLPAMMLKGLHWGYTRFIIQRFWRPLDYTEDNFIRRFHPDDAVIIKKPTLEVAREGASGGDISLCPMAPALKLMGLHKKKPPGHPPTPKEVLDSVNSRVAATQ